MSSTTDMAPTDVKKQRCASGCRSYTYTCERRRSRCLRDAAASAWHQRLQTRRGRTRLDLVVLLWHTAVPGNAMMPRAVEASAVLVTHGTASEGPGKRAHSQRGGVPGRGADFLQLVRGALKFSPMSGLSRRRWAFRVTLSVGGPSFEAPATRLVTFQLASTPASSGSDTEYIREGTHSIRPRFLSINGLATIKCAFAQSTHILPHGRVTNARAAFSTAKGLTYTA